MVENAVLNSIKSCGSIGESHLSKQLFYQEQTQIGWFNQQGVDSMADTNNGKTKKSIRILIFFLKK